MRGQPATMSAAEAARRRVTARRTALLFAGIAAAVYALFILSGVLAR